MVKTGDCRVSEGKNLAGDGSDRVTFDGVKPLNSAPAPFDVSALMLMGATVRSVQSAGAMETILSLSVAYANERVAFERPIGKFQAVQQNLARLAGETAAALAAAGSAADTIAHRDAFDDVVMLEAASAKIRTGEAAAEGSAIAHQVHGAIGFTNEHILHRFTLRLLSWRDDFGSESYWAAALGDMVAQRGANAVLAHAGGAVGSTDEHSTQLRSDPAAARMRHAARTKCAPSSPRKSPPAPSCRTGPAMATATTAPSANASAPKAGSA